MGSLFFAFSLQHFNKLQLFKHFPLVRSLHDDEASVSLDQVTKLAPNAKGQVFQGHGSWQVAFHAEPFIDVPVGSAVFGGRDDVGVIHRDANNFRVFAILRDAGNGQFNKYRLATMVKRVCMSEIG
ncbi:hypothetical protein TNCV_3955101 [Trichonephila clavipes]|nr:hypothetical protein TNCV_3955101 [Trichonephila clavipes]